LLDQRSAFLGEDRDFGFQVVAWLEVRLLLIFFIAFVVGADARRGCRRKAVRSRRSEGGDGLFYLAAELLPLLIEMT
jgi:hypothetical protein